MNNLIQYAGKVTRQRGLRNCTAQSVTNAVEIVNARNGNRINLDPMILWRSIVEIDPSDNKSGSNLRWAIRALEENIVVSVQYRWLSSIEDVLSAAKNNPVVVAIGTTTKWKRYYRILHPFGLKPLGYGKEIDNHAVTIVGVNDREFVLMNSWGRMWGEGGFARSTFDTLIGLKDAVEIIDCRLP